MALILNKLLSLTAACHLASNVLRLSKRLHNRHLKNLPMTPTRLAPPIAKSPLNHPQLHPNRIKLRPISGFRTAYSISQMRLCLKYISNLALLLRILILLSTSNTSNSCNSNSRRNISKCRCSQWECNHRRHNPILTTCHRYLLKPPF